MIDSCEVASMILTPIFIHDFWCVHPFNDGNGHMSRLITILIIAVPIGICGRKIY